MMKDVPRARRRRKTRIKKKMGCEARGGIVARQLLGFMCSPFLFLIKFLRQASQACAFSLVRVIGNAPMN